MRVLLLVFESYESETIEEISQEIIKSFRNKIGSLKGFVVSGIPGILKLIEALSAQENLAHLFTN